MLICLDKLSTTSACQAVVDYNKVGEVEIIGCYSSDAILQAIQKNVLQATVAFDTKGMGEECITAMTEYWKDGHVSEYKPVSVSLITSENIGEEEYVCISIRDNGIGMSQEKIDQIVSGQFKEEEPSKKSNGVGLYNIIQRLRMFYNKEDVIEITSIGRNMGTEVAIKLYWRGV